MNYENVPRAAESQERPPITDTDRANAADWLHEFLDNPENMDLVRTRLQQQKEISRPDAPSILLFGFRKGGGYSTTLALTEQGLQEISQGPHGGYTTAANPPTIKAADTRTAVAYFEMYHRGDPRDLPSWLMGQLDGIEERHKRLAS